MNVLRRAYWLAVLLGSGACASPGAGVQSPVIVARMPTPATPKAGSTSEEASLPLPAALRAFDAEHVTGAMALFDTRAGKLACSDEARCNRGYLPSATFELVSLSLALEGGLLSDAESPLPSDGKAHDNPDWNRNHTLRSAVQASCLPCFQGLVARLGDAPLRAWISRLQYGNQDSSGAPGSFGSSGNLLVSPFQQLDFLRRLDGEKLPLSPRTLDVVREVLTLDVGPDHVLRGVVGLNQPPEQASLLGWYAGYVELGERRAFFATVIDGHSGDVDLKVALRRVTEGALHELQLLP